MTRSHFKLGLLGHPVEHSISPVIHTEALRATGLDGAYRAIDLEPDRLRDWVLRMGEAGFRGVNVTLPFKQAVMPLMDSLSPAATQIGAVNTITVVDGELRGDNTDFVGFLAPLVTSDHLWSGRSGAEALILGSGGAARSVVYALSQLPGLETLAICARSLEKAEAIRATAGESALEIRLEPWARRGDNASRADLVVNTTPIGMWPNTSETPLDRHALRPNQLVYDLVYNPRTTRLLAEAADAGASCVDGLPMLIGQAAEAFRLWTGIAMPMAPVTAAAEAALKNRS